MEWAGAIDKRSREKTVPLGAKMSRGPNALGFDYFCGYTHAGGIGTILEQDTVVAHVQPVKNQPLMLKKRWNGSISRERESPPSCTIRLEFHTSPLFLYLNSWEKVAPGMW